MKQIGCNHIVYLDYSITRAFKDKNKCFNRCGGMSGWKEKIMEIILLTGVRDRLSKRMIRTGGIVIEIVSWFVLSIFVFFYLMFVFTIIPLLGFT